MIDTRSTRGHVLDLIFLVGLVLKGLDGLGELLFGLPLLFLPHSRITALAHSMTAQELTEDPHDVMLTWREWRQHHVLRETFRSTAAWLRPRNARTS
jgi:uncharacterized membrane protein